MNDKPHANNRDDINSQMRRLPQVEVLLGAMRVKPLIEFYSRPLITASIQAVLDEIRLQVTGGARVPPQEEIINLVEARLKNEWPAFRSTVINATGVVLHTNLGRAPMPPEALMAVSELCGHFSVLEYDIATGKRGRRARELERLLCVLTGAEAALVVNNNAAAVLLILVALANGKEAIVSRGELVQIGGGFRVPEIMQQSGVVLREVGTTNQTYLDDYDNAINQDTALLLKVHRSNFTIRGFTNEVTVEELKRLGHKHGLPVIYDIGSGAFFNTEEYGMEHEPTVPEAVLQGADVISFSGDKLFGGPQAGIIIGKREYVDRLRKHQLLRAIRVGKTVVAALEAVVLQYLNKEAKSRNPVWQMIGYSQEEIGSRARTMAARLAQGGVPAEVIAGSSTVGGGSLPDETIPTMLGAIKPEMPLEDFSSRLRLSSPAVIGRIEEGRFLIDLRTVFPDQEENLLAIIKQAGCKA
jgi:L-seryl-tRNA(Ser) seleniumtransferase